MVIHERTQLDRGQTCEYAKRNRRCEGQRERLCEVGFETIGIRRIKRQFPSRRHQKTRGWSGGCHLLLTFSQPSGVSSHRVRSLLIRSRGTSPNSYWQAIGSYQEEACGFEVFHRRLWRERSPMIVERTRDPSAPSLSRETMNESVRGTPHLEPRHRSPSIHTDCRYPWRTQCAVRWAKGWGKCKEPTRKRSYTVLTQYCMLYHLIYSRSLSG